MLWLFQTAVCSYSRTQLRKDVWTSDNFDRLSQQQMNFLLINLTNPLLLHYLSPLGLRMPAKLLRQKHCLNPEYVAYRFLLVELTVYHKPSSSWLSGIRPIIFLPRDFFSTLFSLATVCDISFFYCFFLWIRHLTAVVVSGFGLRSSGNLNLMAATMQVHA